MDVYDAIVVGLGGAGSAAAYHLARGGAKILGIERFGVVHAHGSSHGRTRIYRTAYSEGEGYVPLSQRAQRLWSELAVSSGTEILRRTGGLVIGSPSGRRVSGALRSAAAHALEHQLLMPDDVRERFPQFRLGKDEVALWDPNAGALFPENAIRAHAAGATKAGAELHYDETVLRWETTEEGVRVHSRAGDYGARSLVLTAGPWTPGLTTDLALPLAVERQFVLWFPPSDPALVVPSRMPVFLWEREGAWDTYGLPDFGDGVKVGGWEGKVAVTPEAADRVLHDRDAEPVRRFVKRGLRGLEPRETEAVSCLFTNAPDHDFLVGPYPGRPNVVLVSACSGHGFKFASAIGEVVARLVLGGEVPLDLARFDPGRFGRASPSG